jgi:hypothetical protein
MPCGFPILPQNPEYPDAFLIPPTAPRAPWSTLRFAKELRGIGPLPILYVHLTEMMGAC